MFMIGVVPGCGKPVENSEEAAAIASIQKLKGKIEFEGEGQERRVVKVYLHSTAVQDSDLAVLPKVLKLKNLFLGKTQISDAGLEHLGHCVELLTLSLNSTRVTDEGLKSLSKLSKLKTLNVQETKVTKEGAAVLKRQLPGVTIAR